MASFDVYIRYIMAEILENCCVICRLEFLEADEKTVVTRIGITTLIKFANIRNDSVLSLYLANVLFMHQYQINTMEDVFFQSEATRRRRSGMRIISIRKAVSNYDADMLYNLPFLHAWSGCDSVSAIFGQGKRKVIKYFINSAEFKNKCSVFSNNQVDKNDLEKSGNPLMAILYGGSSQHSLKLLMLC